MEDVSNQFKIALALTNLGLDHLTTPSFQQVKDGFGHSLERGRDFMGRTVTCKHSYTSYSFAHFSPLTQGTRLPT